MRILVSLAAIGVFMTLTSYARAGVLLEPYVGYKAGRASETMGTTGIASLDNKTIVDGYSGPGLGVRAGYQIELFFAALDYMYFPGMPLNLIDNGGVSGMTARGSVDTNDLYAVAGVSIPMIRGYVGLGVLNQMKFSNLNSTASGGLAYKLGASYTGLPFVAINLEYASVNFKKASSNGRDFDIGSGQVYTELKSSDLLLSVSMPFDL